MEHRKDKKNRVLKDGESYREKENRYMYRWLDNDKRRHYIYAATLSELRKKEKEISQNVNDGINTEKSNMRLDELYDWWNVFGKMKVSQKVSKKLAPQMAKK